jgi:hypothetical protein
MQRGGRGISWRGLGIALDAIEVLAEDGLNALLTAAHGRLLGFLPGDCRLSPRDADCVRGLFGIEEVQVRRHGHSPMPVDVIFERIRGGQSLPADLDTVSLRRQGIWYSSVRNSQIASLAEALREENRVGLQKFPRACHGACSVVDTRRVAVVVENAEHGVQLAKKLPGWGLVTAADVRTEGMSCDDRILLNTIIAKSDTYEHAIFTLAAADRIDPGRFDVVIRADAGTGPLPFDEDKLALPNADERRLLLIDFDDRRHPALRRSTLQRRQAYRARGWYHPWADPAEQRVKQFLATMSTE